MWMELLIRRSMLLVCGFRSSLKMFSDAAKRSDSHFSSGSVAYASCLSAKLRTSLIRGSSEYELSITACYTLLSSSSLRSTLFILACS